MLHGTEKKKVTMTDVLPMHLGCPNIHEFEHPEASYAFKYYGLSIPKRV
jgi:hypothetical protein